MLSFVEEIILLLLEDDEGRFIHVPELSIRCVLAGAVLMELALANRIDTDLEELTVIDSTSLNDDLLDPTLQKLVESDQEGNARFWVEYISRDADTFREIALARLVDKKILECVDDRLLWVFKTRRYPLIDGRAEREVKLRIMDILFSDIIPDPRDIVIISLVDACGIFKHLLSEREHQRAMNRIRQCRKMDLIGQAVTGSVREIEASLTMALHPPF